MCKFVVENRKMKVVYIYTSFTIAGGADRVVIEKANYLAEHNYDVTIVTDSQQERAPFFPISPKVKLHDLAIDFEKEYKYNPLIRIFIYLNLMKKYERVLKKYLYQEKPEFVITTLGREIDFITDLNDGSIKIGESHIAKPYIRNLHLLDKTSLLHRMIARMWMKKIIRNCKKLDALVLLTENDAKEWKNLTKTFVIPNALPFYSEEISKCKKHQAIFVGRMSEQKGYDYLIKAWESVYDKHPDWILNIYGDGEEKEEIKKMIVQKGLNKVIILNGTTKNIQEKYINSSLCILSSRFEGFGMVLLEAMSCGVPCIAFNCPYGPSEIIHHNEDGYLADYLNSDSLSNYICQLIEDESLRILMGQKAHINIQRYNKEDIMRKWIGLFNSLKKY